MFRLNTPFIRNIHKPVLSRVVCERTGAIKSILLTTLVASPVRTDHPAGDRSPHGRACIPGRHLLPTLWSLEIARGRIYPRRKSV
jgi:hypothetical protein